MKKILLFCFLASSNLFNAQLLDAFTFNGAASTNGWVKHSGTAGQIVSITTPSNSGNSLAYSGLAASSGNRIALSTAYSEDINKATTGLSTTGYCSFLLKVVDTLSLSTAGDYFLGFGSAASATLTSFGGNVCIKKAPGNNVFIGIKNNSSAATTQIYDPTPRPVGTTLFVAFKLICGATPIQASLFVNPIPGGTEPSTPTAFSNSGTTAFASIASVYIREGSNTGNLEIDEIRVGTSWAAITPAGIAPCYTTSTITQTHCGPLTINSQTYSTSGTYTQTLTNSNSVGCDSIITLNLTIKNPTSSSLTQSACNTFTLNNTTYNSSGTYTQTLNNSVGCDSVITLNLSIVSGVTYYMDMDSDGYGNSSMTQIGCSQPTGYVTNNTDCNDNNNAIHPGAIDIPGNNIDEDCSGSDTPLIPIQLGLYEFTAAMACPVTANTVTTQPTNALFSIFSTANTTCSPTANVWNNSAWNTLSNIDTSEYNQFTLTADSCKDINLEKLIFLHKISSSGGSAQWHIRSSLDNFAVDISSGACSTTNKIDTVIFSNLYSGLGSITLRFYITNMGNAGSTFRLDNVSLFGNIVNSTPHTFYLDADSDGFGSPATSIIACHPPIGYVNNSTDCNDANAVINPMTYWYQDLDNDNLGNANVNFIGCTPPSLNYVLTNGDCNDNNNSIQGPVTYYLDADLDGFGLAGSDTVACVNPGVGYSTLNTDCNDTISNIYPGAPELCDGYDNDCNGLTDEGLLMVEYWIDEDNDSFGTGTPITSCSNPGIGYATIDGDCNDTINTIYPGAPELCDGYDNDCNGLNDDGLIFISYWADNDNDNYGAGIGMITCTNPGIGYTTQNGDCDDTNPSIHPNAVEIYDNGIDENCDGTDNYLGINSIDKTNFSIVPNPTNGIVNIELSQNTMNATISIAALNGQVIETFTTSSSNSSRDLSYLNEGMYLITVATANGNTTKRIVIKK